MARRGDSRKRASRAPPAPPDDGASLAADAVEAAFAAEIAALPGAGGALANGLAAALARRLGTDRAWIGDLPSGERDPRLLGSASGAADEASAGEWRRSRGEAGPGGGERSSPLRGDRLRGARYGEVAMPVPIVAGSAVAAAAFAAPAPDPRLVRSLLRLAALRAAAEVGRSRTDAEVALSLAGEPFRRLWDSGIVGIAIGDDAGRLAEANDAFLRMLGYTRDEFRSRPFDWRDLTPPEHLGADQGALQEGLSNGVSTPYEKEFFRKDGSRIPVLLAGALLRRSQHAGIAFVLDITERKRIEAAARDADVLRRQIVASAREGIVAVNRDLIFRLWNPAMEELTGLPAREVLGCPLFERFPFLRDVGMEAAMKRGFAGETVLLPDFPFSIPESGRSGWVSTSSSPLRNESGEVVGVICTVRDVTERRRLEDEVAQLQKMDAAGRVAASVAHDFGALVAGIRCYAQILLDESPPGDPRRKDIEPIVATADQAVALARRLIASRRGPPRAPGAIDIDAALRRALEWLAPLVGSTVEVQVAALAARCEVVIDPEDVDQIILNLATNARDAMPHGGGLTIETANVHLSPAEARDRGLARSGYYVLLTVRDTGEGIPVDVLEHIFEPYFTTKSGGTGLGLFTVYSIVRRAGGRVAVSSVPGKGAVFEVFLPCAGKVKGAKKKEKKTGNRKTK